MSRIKLVLILFLLLLASFQPVFSEEASIKKGEVLSLERCLDIALKKNPNVDLATNTTKVFRSKIGQARSAFLPQVNLTSGYLQSSPVGIVNNTGQYAGSVSLNQNIYDFGKTSTNLKIQHLNLGASDFDADNTTIQIEFNVKQAFYAALTSKINKDIINQSIRQYEKHLDQAKAFFEAGTKSKIDVTTAQVNLSNAKLNLLNANVSYKIALSNLNNAMGLPTAPDYDIADSLIYKNPGYNLSHITKTGNFDKPTIKITNKTATSTKPVNVPSLKSSVTEYSITENLVFKKYDVSFEDALKEAYANRPDLKSIIIKESSAKQSVKLAKKNYLPSVAGVASYGFGGQEFPLGHGFSFGVNANVPVFDGLLTKSQIDQAKASFDVAKSQVEILKQNIYMQVQQAYITLTQAEQSIPISEVSVKQAKENLDLANGRYNVGVGYAVELQDAEISYNNAQLAYVQTFYNYYVARSNLEKAIGIK